MLKLIRNRIMKKICLSNGSFCIWKSCQLWSIAFLFVQPPYLANLDGFSTDTLLFPFLPPLFSCFLLSCHLYSVFLFFCFFPSCCHLNFLFSCQVWSDFPFCHKGVLEWLWAIWSESEIYIQALDLLSWQAPLSPLPLDFWEFLLSTPQSLLVTWFL